MFEYLYGNERKILSVVFKYYKKNSLISKNELTQKLKLDKKDISLLCQSLCKKGYLTSVGTDYNPKITAKGIDYFSAEITNSFETMLKSIFCPIIVSFITTLITLLLKGSL